MTKRMVDIDDHLLGQARSMIGTTTIRATVEAALRRVVNEETVRRHVEWLRTADGLELDALTDLRVPRLVEDA